MNKGKSIGICCLIAAAVILVVALVYWGRAEDESSYGTENGRATETTLSAVSGQEINAVQTVETVREKEQLSGQTVVETEEPEHGEYSVAEMDIKDMNEEVLSLMGVTEEILAKEIRIFANGYGFAGITEAFYYGETVIDHKKDIVSAAFYFELPENGTYKFNIIVQRKKKTFRFEPW